MAQRLRQQSGPRRTTACCARPGPTKVHIETDNDVHLAPLGAAVDFFFGFAKCRPPHSRQGWPRQRELHEWLRGSSGSATHARSSRLAARQGGAQAQTWCRLDHGRRKSVDRPACARRRSPNFPSSIPVFISPPSHGQRVRISTVTNEAAGSPTTCLRITRYWSQW